MAYTNVRMSEEGELNSLQVTYTSFMTSKNRFLTVNLTSSNWWLSRPLDWDYLVANIVQCIHEHAADVIDITTSNLMGHITLRGVNLSDEEESEDVKVYDGTTCEKPIIYTINICFSHMNFKLSVRDF